jgi:hypothetical protein
MRWMRSRMRLGSWAALLALAIQLALSFGHIHLGGGSLRSGLGPIALRWTTLPPPASPDASTAPARHKSASLADDLCIICAAMQLAYTPAAAGLVPLLATVSQILSDPSSDFALAASPHRLFRARAPPFA